MKFRMTIQTVYAGSSIGAVHHSDWTNLEDEGLTKEAAEDTLGPLLDKIKTLESLTLVINGATRYFNPKNVIWAQLDFEED